MSEQGREACFELITVCRPFVVANLQKIDFPTLFKPTPPMSRIANGAYADADKVHFKLTPWGRAY